MFAPYGDYEIIKPYSITPLRPTPYSIFPTPYSLFNRKGSNNISYITTFPQKKQAFTPLPLTIFNIIQHKKGRSMLRPYYFICKLNYSTIFLNKFFIFTSAPMIACKSLIATRCCSIVSR